MNDADRANRANKVLERVGSPYRAGVGSLISDSVIALLEALPEHIEREIQKAVAKARK